MEFPTPNSNVTAKSPHRDIQAADAKAAAEHMDRVDAYYHERTLRFRRRQTVPRDNHQWDPYLF